MPFFIGFSPVHNRFQTCASRPHAVGSVSTRDPPILSIRAVHFRINRVAVAQLIFSREGLDTHVKRRLGYSCSHSTFGVSCVCVWSAIIKNISSSYYANIHKTTSLKNSCFLLQLVYFLNSHISFDNIVSEIISFILRSTKVFIIFQSFVII